MKLIVRENVNKVAEPTKKVWTVVINSVDGYGKIPISIGQAKGDIIVYKASGDAVRFPKSASDGKVLATDSTTETGLAWVNNGSARSSASVTNGTGGTVAAGTIVYIDKSTVTFKKATSTTTGQRFYIVSETCAAGAAVDCYTAEGAIVNVLCDTAAIAVGGKIAVSSSIAGYGTNSSSATIGYALTAKASGSTGTVRCLFTATSSGVTDIAYRPNYIMSTTDPGTGSSLASGRLYFVYS